MRRQHVEHPKPPKIKQRVPSSLKKRFILVHDWDPVHQRKKPVLLHWAANRRHNNSKKSSRRKGNLKGLRPLMNPAYVRKVLRLGFKGYTLKHMIPQHKDEIDYILRKLRERGRVF